MATDLTPSSPIYVGDTETLTATFLTAAGAAATVLAADVTLTVEEPDGTSTDLTGGDLTVSSGVVTAPFAFDQSGWHYVRWAWDDGSDAETQEARVYVRRTDAP